jgi:Delta7-sterol 5-desaturase
MTGCRGLARRRCGAPTCALFPAFAKLPALFPGSKTCLSSRLHHSSFHYNYGLYFTWWDYLMGTEHPAYREKLRGSSREAGAARKPVAPYPSLAQAGAAAMSGVTSGE